jgi:RhtB (resistance to homoserine/threonine) family protein
MPDLQQLLVFIAAGWLLNLTPGPDVFYIVTNSLRSGPRAGVVAGLGITAGCFVHVLAAALGLGALLATSAAAFTVLKYAGAGYLLYMGAKMLLAKRPPPSADLMPLDVGNSQVCDYKAVFLGGFLTNVLNPKVALFFLAFVPQFIAPESQNKAEVFVLLGIIFNLNAVPVNAGWALAAAWLASRRSVQRGIRWLEQAAACMFIAFGLKLALSDNSAS